MRKLIHFSFLILACCLSWFATAAELVTLTLVERTNQTELPVYHARGQHYVAGQPTQRYSVRLNNRSSGRVLAVLSVDGINAVSGETASPKQTGYVLDAYEQVEIAGWRKSDSDVAQFYFTALPDSYAARTNRPDNVGVIGVAVFREKVQPPPVVIAPLSDGTPRRGVDVDRDPNDSRMMESSAGRMSARPPAPAPAAAPAKRAERIGTGHGEREYAPVTHTEFVRASNAPAEVVTLRYDSREHLIDMGVIPRPTREPQAFPNRYVPDPPR